MPCHNLGRKMSTHLYFTLLKQTLFIRSEDIDKQQKIMITDKPEIIGPPNAEIIEIEKFIQNLKLHNTLVIQGPIYIIPPRTQLTKYFTYTYKITPNNI